MKRRQNWITAKHRGLQRANSWRLSWRISQCLVCPRATKSKSKSKPKSRFKPKRNNNNNNWNWDWNNQTRRHLASQSLICNAKMTHANKARLSLRFLNYCYRKRGAVAGSHSNTHKQNVAGSIWVSLWELSVCVCVGLVCVTKRARDERQRPLIKVPRIQTETDTPTWLLVAQNRRCKI